MNIGKSKCKVYLSFVIQMAVFRSTFTLVHRLGNFRNACFLFLHYLGLLTATLGYCVNPYHFTLGKHKADYKTTEWKRSFMFKSLFKTLQNDWSTLILHYKEGPSALTDYDPYLWLHNCEQPRKSQFWLSGQLFRVPRRSVCELIVFKVALYNKYWYSQFVFASFYKLASSLQSSLIV